jgi:hypothetical protein
VAKRPNPKQNSEPTEKGSSPSEESPVYSKGWPEHAQRPPHGSGVGAAILISLGVIFLLNNFGLLPWSVWADLWRLWPLVLVLIGLQIIFGSWRLTNLVITVVGIAAVAYILILSLAASNLEFDRRVREQAPWLPRQHMQWLTRTEEQQEQITIKEDQYQNVTDRKISADIGVGKLTIADSESKDYFDVRASYFTNFGKPRLSHRVSNGVLSIDFDTEGGFGFFTGWPGTTAYDITLGKPELTTDFSVDVGTGSSEIRLDRLEVAAFRIKVGTGTASVELTKASIPSSNVILDVGTGTIKLRLPKDAALKVKHDVGTGRLKIDDSTIEGDGTYTSENYESAATRLELDIEVGTGTITIERI